MTRGARWGVLLALLALAAWLALFGDKTPPGTVRVLQGSADTAMPTGAARQIPSPSPSAVPALARRGTARLEAIEALLPRASMAGEPSAPVADLFRNAAWRAKPPPVPPSVMAPPAPERAPVPRQPYRVIGKKFEAASWEVFLGRDDQILIVRTGDTVEGTWRVEQIAPPLLTFTHLPSGQRQTLDVGAAL